MTGRRLTLGVTINLGHYENLRVEVEGEPGEEPATLAAFLDDLLASFGRSDPPTAALIDTYRSRIRWQPGKEDDPAPEKTWEDEDHGIPGLMPPGPFDQDDLREDEAGETGGSPGEVETALEEESPGTYGIGGPDLPVPSVHEWESPGAMPGFISPFAQGMAVCEGCRVPVSPAEEKLSRLFASRVLCRTCLKKIQ